MGVPARAEESSPKDPDTDSVDSNTEGLSVSTDQRETTAAAAVALAPLAEKESISTEALVQVHHLPLPTGSSEPSEPSQSHVSTPEVAAVGLPTTYGEFAPVEDAVDETLLNDVSWRPIRTIFADCPLQQLQYH
jgi:hypothetical protein